MIYNEQGIIFCKQTVNMKFAIKFYVQKKSNRDE